MVLKTPGLSGLWSDLAVDASQEASEDFTWRVVAAATEPPPSRLTNSRRQSGAERGGRQRGGCKVSGTSR